MRLDLIASGGWIPTSERETCCLLARDGDHALIIDAGTGIATLVEHPELLEGVRQVDILLTHFHLDHVIGLAYLPGLALDAPTAAVRPGQRALRSTDRGDPRQADRPAAVRGRGGRPARMPAASCVKAAQQLGGFAVSCRAQRRHPDPTLAIRLGDELAYCTDTAFDEGNIEFARGRASPRPRGLVHRGRAGRQGRPLLRPRGGDDSPPGGGAIAGPHPRESARRPGGARARSSGGLRRGRRRPRSAGILRESS